MIYLQLIWEFFKTGLFSVGGGLATLPFLKAISLKYPWFTPNDLLDMIAVSESTPGPIGINTATYAGFHAAGLGGSVIATCSLVFPSVVIIILISRALTRFRDSALVRDAFYGLRPASAGLIFGAMLEVFAASLFHTELACVIKFPCDRLFPGAIAVYLEIPQAPSHSIHFCRGHRRHPLSVLIKNGGNPIVSAVFYSTIIKPER